MRIKNLIPGFVLVLLASNESGPGSTIIDSVTIVQE